ncbi:MAG TPA: 1,4-alpha-glucan branching protein GlgB [Polyangiaceae bacterium]|jgi:1,4-alpha-glucan branching enzyme|nr:MAG: 1,4-alpha-glucan branching enzyme GlgB [Deltaproteobacteria bacterium ADurb.Bin207]HNZ21715.1 1,4-alpha-glucan branching protein GlgB [Polyangiaceae bacterium]HOD21619.1 1,4-alpha-glucan branching protein GlgB [Polyangiaceae bacterium]HOE49554.1 1,4-alpha-glucan branching protein GlgB [Polyangiaceae bacterium]HOG99724.1 1,4-alpha-glucan branching protein GlgB [Polyangiaceae bacterium]
MSIHRNEIVAIADAQHGQPFQVLGPHQDEHGACIRAYHPMAVACWIVGIDDGKLLAEAKLIEPRGVFEAALTSIPSAYRLRYRNEKGDEWEEEDPYRFASQLSEFDLHLLREGTHYRTWEKLGAHLVTIDGVHGVRFVVWAPNAKRVSVVGDFNQWDGRRHAMRKHEGNGLWEIFVPGVGHGDVYKFEVFPNHGELAMLKADPFAFYTEVPPKSASRVYDLSGYSWKDDAWMAARAKAEPLAEPVSVYEVHLGSWMHKEDGFSLSYREAAHKLAAYVKEMGFTHVELLPITEHPFYGSWGYQTMHFFAPTSRFGTPSELMEFIDVLHENGIGVILDWVPAHFPTDGHGLAEFDGTHLYEHADPREGIHRDWNTMVFNYGRTEVWNFLLASALFWMEVYHFDGIRVDAVASMLYRDYSRKEGDWIPNRFGGRENLEAVEFIKHLNVLLYQYFPGVITIAEESTAWAGVSRPTYLGGLGFTFKWNMGWMHDVLGYMSKEPIHRKYHANEFTFSMLYAYTENFVLALSHDEVVYGKGSLLRKMPGDDWQKFANNRLLFGYMFTHPGKKHLFMGMEFGQWNEWDHNRGLDWHLLSYAPHQGLQRWLKDLHALYRSEPALTQLDYAPEGFRWIDCHDTDNSVYSYLRYAKDQSRYVVVVCNFTPVPREGYRIGVPEPGWYAERLNSDSGIYGGSNMGNAGGLQAEPTPWQGFDWSISLTVPPLACLILQRS